jgi:hypothetical protein
MSYSMDLVTTDFQDFGDSSLFASVEPGSNGDTSGDPTYVVGDDQGMENWGFNTWDSDTSDGWDSGTVSVNFTGQSNGSESLSVQSNPAIAYNGDGFGPISSVQIDAQVEIPASVQWSNISVKFYSQGALMETETIPGGPQVDTTSTPDSPQAQQVLTVFPKDSNDDTVVVDATIRMTAPAGTVPGSTSMFAGIFVNDS